MNVAGTSNGVGGGGGSGGYAKYQIRSSGMPRVLAQEADVFTLDDQEHELMMTTENDRMITAKSNGNTGIVSKEGQEEEKSRLVECSLDSDEEEEEDDEKTMTKEETQRDKKPRLRDSFDLDNDSLSDDLDLLPPIPGAPNTNTSSYFFQKLHRFNCCNPRIPSKCTIM